MELTAYQDCFQEALLGLWNESLTMDPISPDIFARKVLGDENFDPALTLLAWEGNRLLGFILLTRRRVPYLDRGLEPETGWILAMGVRPEHRRKGVGAALLRRGEEMLEAGGASKIVLGAYSPNYFFPGIDVDAYAPAAAFFRRHGYRAGEPAYAMNRLLFGYQIPEGVLEKEKKAREAGFWCARYREEFRPALFRFLEENFSAGWRYNARLLIDRGLAENQMWLCLRDGGEVVGYCQRGMDANPNRFGPFGVAEAHRNHSLGSILFCRMLYDMACQGVNMVFFLSTDDPGARFYHRQGLEVYRTFHHCDKELPR